jgi:hypothetical protein
MKRPASIFRKPAMVEWLKLANCCAVYSKPRSGLGEYGRTR